MINKDADVLWKPGHLYVPAWHFTGLDYETTTSTDIKSIGTGTGNDMAIAAINSARVTGIAFGANADTVETLLQIPFDLDLDKPTYFRVLWTANNTSGSVTWAVTYRPFIYNSTVVDNTALTALDSTIAANTMAGVAYTLMRTAEGRMNGSKLPDTTEMWQLAVARTAATTVTSAIFIGLDVRYTPKRLAGVDGMRVEAKAPTYIQGKAFPNT